jgi:small subunit ribosomal protein S20
MPNIKSAIKRVKVSEKRRLVNKMKTSALRTEIKKIDLAIEAGVEGVKDIAKQAQKAIDQAASNGILHKNTAARRNSRIARAINKQA